MGFGPCGMGHSGFLGFFEVVVFYINISPEKELFLHDIDVRTHVPMHYSNQGVFYSLFKLSTFFIIIWLLVCYKK